MVWEELLFEAGGRLDYRNGMILAILNLHTATMPPTNNLWFGRCRLKNFKMAAVTPLNSLLKFIAISL